MPELIRIAQREDLLTRIPDAETFARRNRVVLLRHQATGINVDISLGLLPFEIESVERSQLIQAGSLQIRLPTPEDLIIQKAVAHRPKDMTDIEAVVASQPPLDWERIRHWVEQFAELLETPEIWTDLAHFTPKPSLLQPKPKSKRKK